MCLLFWSWVGVALQFASFDPVKVKSTPQVRTDLFGRNLDRVLVTDFFGSVRNIELLNQTVLVGVEGEGPEERRTSSPDDTHPLPPARYLTPGEALVMNTFTHVCMCVCVGGGERVIQFGGLVIGAAIPPQAIPKADQSSKVNAGTDLIAVGLFMTVITIATMVGIYRVIIADHHVH